ncbi:MAG: energy transducer TonB [Bradymonadia bacterium]
MRLRAAIRALVFGLVSLGVHAVLAGRMERIRPPPEKPKATPIRMFTAPPPAPSAAPPPPPPSAPPPPAPDASARPKPAAPRAPKPSAPTPVAKAAAAGFADLGLELGGGTGPGGMAVPTGGGPAPEAPPVERRPAKPARVQKDTPPCDDPPTKPRPVETPLPVYPEAARAAGVEGRTRVELEVDVQGNVVDAKVLESPGHGLDVAALEAVRRWKFTPGQHCGVATTSRFNARVTFAP